VKQVQRVVVVVTILCMALVGADVPLAVHLHQVCGYNDTSRTGRPAKERQPHRSHDPSKCPFCIHFGSLKTTLAGFTGQIGFTANAVEKLFLFKTAFRPSVCLSSLSPRSPPLYLLT
jgi:hypothetical protein